MPDGSEFQSAGAAMGGEGGANTRNIQRVSVCRLQSIQNNIYRFLTSHQKSTVRCQLVCEMYCLC